MKKYFMKGTDEEVKFGDVLELDCSKDMEDGHTCHHHLECKFIPELVETLIDEGIIEAKDIENERIDFDDIDPQMEIIIKDIAELANNYKELKHDINQIKNLLLFMTKNPSKDAKKPEGK